MTPEDKEMLINCVNQCLDGRLRSTYPNGMVKNAILDDDNSYLDNFKMVYQSYQNLKDKIISYINGLS